MKIPGLFLDQTSLLPIWSLVLHTHSRPLVAGCYPENRQEERARETEEERPEIIGS